MEKLEVTAEDPEAAFWGLFAIFSRR